MLPNSCGPKTRFCRIYFGLWGRRLEQVLSRKTSKTCSGALETDTACLVGSLSEALPLRALPPWVLVQGFSISPLCPISVHFPLCEYIPKWEITSRKPPKGGFLATCGIRFRIRFRLRNSQQKFRSMPADDCKRGIHREPSCLRRCGRNYGIPTP